LATSRRVDIHIVSPLHNRIALSFHSDGVDGGSREEAWSTGYRENVTMEIPRGGSGDQR